MDQTQMQQQFETIRNDVNQIKKESARKNAIKNHVTEHYNGSPPRVYATNLLEALQDRYTSNAAVWKRVIRNLGSAYELALTNFNQIKSIRNMEAQTKSRWCIIFYPSLPVPGCAGSDRPCAHRSYSTKPFPARALKPFFPTGSRK